jgi:phage FluMu protein Com
MPIANLREWRCPACNHLILKHDGRGFGTIETRCPRCKTFVTLKLDGKLDNVATDAITIQR